MAKLSGWDRPTSPYHRGEQALHERLGRRERQEALGRKVHRPYMPEQHREFFNQLPFLVVGSVDREGSPWASLLFGRPGFLTTPSDRKLVIEARPLPGDPLADNSGVGAPLGLLGIEPPTRRRNRLNGVVASSADGRTEVDVVQSFGNCPQYIQTRSAEFVRDPSEPADPSVDTLDALDREAVAQIESADTFFVASHNHEEDPRDTGGVDVNHRGGLPGFVKVEGNTLTIPDFSGNNAFNTLGNFIVNPKAGLLFVDFANGDLLLLTGTAEILWDKTPEIEAVEGAQRAWRVHVERGLRLRGASPLRWEFGDFSPRSKATGTWHDANNSGLPTAPARPS